MSRRPIILSLTTAMHEAGMNLLREGSELRIASSLKPETLRREVVDADALVIRTGGEIDAALMDCGRNLKVVGRHGVGYDQIDVDAATERGIQVLYTPGANTESVCEHVFAMMIGVLEALPPHDVVPGGRRLPRADQQDGARHLWPHARHHRLRPDRPAGRRRGAPGLRHAQSSITTSSPPRPRPRPAPLPGGSASTSCSRRPSTSPFTFHSTPAPGG